MDNVIIVMGKMREKCLVLKDFLQRRNNTHLEHLEDDIINRGSKGGQMLLTS